MPSQTSTECGKHEHKNNTHIQISKDHKIDVNIQKQPTFVTVMTYHLINHLITNHKSTTKANIFFFFNFKTTGK
jgi:hypothetical protein